MPTDKERLDFLDQMNSEFNRRTGTTYGWGIDVNHNRVALTDMHFPAISVREAIDKKMAEKAS